MTTTVLLLIVAYSAMLGLIAKRELPEALRLPLWLMSASAAAGMALTSFAITTTAGLGWIAYPIIVLSGALSLVAVALVIRPLRTSEGADSLTA